ncbi:hypothetical protein ACU8OG_08355 [Rhizobium leguminosarum]
MTHEIEGRLAEIEREIGPLLDHLGVELNVTYVKGAIRVGTVPKEGNTYFSPVTIVFEVFGIPEWCEADWRLAKIERDVFSRKVIGQTGWECWKFEHTFRWGHRPVRETLDLLRREVEEAGVVPDVARTPNCIENQNVAGVYGLLKNRYFDNVEIDQDRVSMPGEVVETVSFVDDLGREVAIPMRVGDSHATCFVDGEEFYTFEQDDLSAIRAFVRDLRTTPLSSQSANP